MAIVQPYAPSKAGNMIRSEEVMSKYRYAAQSKTDHDQTVYGLDRLGIPYTVTSKMGDDHDADVFMGKTEPRRVSTGKWRQWFIEIDLTT